VSEACAITGRPRRARPRGRDRHPANRPGRAGPADPQPSD